MTKSQVGGKGARGGDQVPGRGVVNKSQVGGGEGVDVLTKSHVGG